MKNKAEQRNTVTGQTAGQKAGQPVPVASQKMTPHRDSLEAPSPRSFGPLNRSRKPVPEPLPGRVYPDFVRCGNPGCHCMKGGAKHGPYFSRWWREGGRLRRSYVARELVEETRERCAAWHERKARRRRKREEVRALLAEVRAELRQADAALRLLGWKR